MEMRREQYTLRDSFRQTLLAQTTDDYCIPPVMDFDAGIEVLPLGLKHKGVLSGVVFRKWPELNPMNTPSELLQDISDLYWKKKNYKSTGTQCYFDFREVEHVY